MNDQKILKEKRAEWLNTHRKIQRAFVESKEKMEVIYYCGHVSAQYIIGSGNPENYISIDGLVLRVVKWKTGNSEVFFLLITKQSKSTSSDDSDVQPFEEDFASIYPLMPETIAFFNRKKSNGFVLYDVENLDGSMIEFMLKQSAQFGDDFQSFLKARGLKVLNVEDQPELESAKNLSSVGDENEDEACHAVYMNAALATIGGVLVFYYNKWSMRRKEDDSTTDDETQEGPENAAQVSNSYASTVCYIYKCSEDLKNGTSKFLPDPDTVMAWSSGDDNSAVQEATGSSTTTAADETRDLNASEQNSMNWKVYFTTKAGSNSVIEVGVLFLANGAFKIVQSISGEPYAAITKQVIKTLGNFIIIANTAKILNIEDFIKKALQA